ncbi:phosphoribosylformylglycinamidine synthase, purS [Salinispora tropica CNB-440]|uniref:Phosphoribosylformylglycinamidine synthase subunit PurS n=1 Tax=Salinispora tropica (strain ATCC BAA-916 / DSM 44818 / JCM 13857 / NBRC 105044 / CNB-440) TaxID=369723 RepID=A4X185_SALTO|nr:phosphoribosylformylglycinamidine synthase, purS [Salinispora tropica CNB-440]
MRWVATKPHRERNRNASVLVSRLNCDGDRPNHVRPVRPARYLPGRLAALAPSGSAPNCVHSQECPVPRVVVDVMLKPEILDPQGQAVANALPRLGVTDVASVRIGRRIEIEFTGEPDLNRTREIADKLLANPVIEDFTIRLAEDGETVDAQP